MLERGHVPGPYVMAGHSVGGLFVLTFAGRYPDEVAGKVLVDATAPGSAATAATSPGTGLCDRSDLRLLPDELADADDDVKPGVRSG